MTCIANLLKYFRQQLSLVGGDFLMSELIQYHYQIYQYATSKWIQLFLKDSSIRETDHNQSGVISWMTELVKQKKREVEILQEREITASGKLHNRL